MLQNDQYIAFFHPVIHKDNEVHLRIPYDEEIKNHVSDEFSYDVSTLNIKLLKLVWEMSKINI